MIFGNFLAILGFTHFFWGQKRTQKQNLSKNAKFWYSNRTNYQVWELFLYFRLFMMYYTFFYYYPR